VQVAKHREADRGTGRHHAWRRAWLQRGAVRTDWRHWRLLVLLFRRLDLLWHLRVLHLRRADLLRGLLLGWLRRLGLDLLLLVGGRLLLLLLLDGLLHLARGLLDLSRCSRCLCLCLRLLVTLLLLLLLVVLRLQRRQLLRGHVRVEEVLQFRVLPSATTHQLQHTFSNAAMRSASDKFMRRSLRCAICAAWCACCA